MLRCIEFKPKHYIFQYTPNESAPSDIDASEYFDAVQDEYWEAWEQLQAEDISEQEKTMMAFSLDAVSQQKLHVFCQLAPDDIDILLGASEVAANVGTQINFLRLAVEAGYQALPDDFNWNICKLPNSEENELFLLAMSQLAEAYLEIEAHWHQAEKLLLRLNKVCPESDLGTDQQLLRLYQTMGEWRKAQAVCKRNKGEHLVLFRYGQALSHIMLEQQDQARKHLAAAVAAMPEAAEILLRQPSEEELEAEYDAALEEMGADLEQFELEDEREWAGGETPLNRSRLAMVTYYQDCGHLWAKGRPAEILAELALRR